MINLKNKIIGIWGLGITGKSVINFLHKHFPSNSLVATDSKKLNTQQQNFLKNNNVDFLSNEELENFLKKCDVIIPSPGISLKSHNRYHNKMLSELDLFQHFFNKKTIAITGTLGKTTITHMLAQLLNSQGVKSESGGNIGIGLLDLIEKQSNLDCAVLELSSFQLEYTKAFAPDIAIWTNFHPNHLDKHKNINEYLSAKQNIYKNQNHNQKCLINAEIIEHIEGDLIAKNNVSFFSIKKPPRITVESFNNDTKWFYLQNNNLVRLTNNTEKKIAKLPNTQSTFEINWVIMLSTLNLLEISIPTNKVLEKIEPVSENRIEFIKTINGIDFYNDSKATISQSTIAAVEKLSDKNITLILGGISKGVDRESLIEQLQGKIKQAVCFGKESEQLHKWCKKHGIDSCEIATLDDASNIALNKTSEGEIILLSPAGASFDLYSSYIERGNHFKKLVHDLSQKANSE